MPALMLSEFSAFRRNVSSASAHVEKDYALCIAGLFIALPCWIIRYVESSKRMLGATSSNALILATRFIPFYFFFIQVLFEILFFCFLF